MQPNHPSQPEFLHLAYPGSGTIYSFEVEQVDQEYEKFKNEGTPILLPIRTEDWGQRHFMIKDPGGMIIDVVQTIEPTDEYKSKYNQ